MIEFLHFILLFFALFLIKMERTREADLFEITGVKWNSGLLGVTLNVENYSLCDE